MEYTLNNQNTTFPPENESDDIESLENESDLSCDKNNISNDSGVAVDLFNGNCVGEKSIDVVLNDSAVVDKFSAVRDKSSGVSVSLSSNLRLWSKCLSFTFSTVFVTDRSKGTFIRLDLVQ
jgi:hypothetical protein